MSQEYDIKCQHFAVLKDKYEATEYEDCSPSSPLYLVLRKVDLGVEILDLEYIWLQKEKLLKTANLIRNEQSDILGWVFCLSRFCYIIILQLRIYY